MGSKPAVRTMSDFEREALIVDRRADSVPFRTIAAEIGMSVGYVHKVFNEACSRIPAAAMHTLRTQSADLADRAIADLLKIAEDVSVSPRTRAEAWNSIRGWSESLRKLYGADAPQRKEITVLTDDVIDSAIKKLTEEMEALDAQAELAVEKLIEAEA